MKSSLEDSMQLDRCDTFCLVCESGAADARLPAVSAFGLWGDHNHYRKSGPASLDVEWSGHLNGGHGDGTRDGAGGR